MNVWSAAPLLWHDFSWYSPAYHNRNPDNAQILTNARHNQTLTIQIPAGPTPPLLSMSSLLTRLTSLHLPYLSSEVLHAIQHYREMLVTVALRARSSLPPSSEVIAFWDLIAACPRLTSLELPDAISSSEPNGARLIHQGLAATHYPQPRHLATREPCHLPLGIPWTGFPMRDLTVHTLPETNLLFITELFARCPGLAWLQWKAGHYHRYMYDMELRQVEELVF